MHVNAAAGTELSLTSGISRDLAIFKETVFSEQPSMSVQGAEVPVGHVRSLHAVIEKISGHR